MNQVPRLLCGLAALLSAGVAVGTPRASCAVIEATLNFASADSQTPVSDTRVTGLGSVDCDFLCIFPKVCEIDAYYVGGLDVNAQTGHSDMRSGADGVGCGEGEFLSFLFEGEAHVSWNGDEASGRVVGTAGSKQGCGDFSAVCDALGVWITSHEFDRLPSTPATAHFDAHIAPLSATYTGLRPDTFRRRGAFVLFAGSNTIVGAARSASAQSGEMTDGFDENGDYSTTFQVTQGNDQELRIVVYDFHESRLDVNEDGRFSVADRTALAGILNSTDRVMVSRFDANNDGDIDQADVDLVDWLMLNLILGDADSGIFGDLDQDGDVDCDDLDLVPTYEDAVLGDANYLVEFDSNLDGASDDVDKGRLFNIVRPGDADWNQAVNFADVTVVLTFWNQTVTPYTSGDVTGNGTVNFEDITKIYANYNQTCP